jgi:hypothetical protein
MTTMINSRGESRLAAGKVRGRFTGETDVISRPSGFVTMWLGARGPVRVTSGNDLGMPAGNDRLRSLLRDYYPQALVAFPKLAHPAAANVLRAASTPHAAG